MSKSSAAVKVSDVASAEMREQVKKLVSAHRKRKDEPLHLAVYFKHPKHRKDVCLLEVLGGFGDGQIDEKRRLFEIAFSSTPEFPLPQGRSLRMYLTSPEELKEAVRGGWSAIRDVRGAFQTGQAEVLFEDGLGAKLAGLLR